MTKMEISTLQDSKMPFYQKKYAHIEKTQQNINRDFLGLTRLGDFYFILYANSYFLQWIYIV